MYSQMKACVKVKNGLTDFFYCKIGTKQGCLSSPIIFAMFMNDLVNFLRSKEGDGVYISPEIDRLFVLMYADDVSGASRYSCAAAATYQQYRSLL